MSQQIRDYLAVLLQNEEETFLDEIRDRLKLKEYVEKHGVIIQNKIEESKYAIWGERYGRKK